MFGGQPPSSAGAVGAARCPACSAEARIQIVRKEGANHGRRFWICGACDKFVRWAHPTESGGDNRGPARYSPVKGPPPPGGTGSAPSAPKYSPAARSSASSSNAPRLGITIEVELAALLPVPRFALQHTYNQALIDSYKQLPSSEREYDPEARRWSFPLACLNEVTRLAQSAGGTLKHMPDFLVKGLASASLQALLESITRGPAAGPVLEGRLPGPTIRMLKPYQVQGIKFALTRSRALIGDEMGLGKTLQAICILAYHRELWPALIIVPSSLRFQWKDKLLEHLGPPPPRLDDDDDDLGEAAGGEETWEYISESDVCVLASGKSVIKGSFLVASYDLLVKLVETGRVKPGQYKIVCADESHYLKSPDAQRTKAVVPLIQKAAVAVLLSGTPAVSKPVELFMQLQALLPSLFSNYHHFTVRYCNGHNGPRGWNADGASHERELKLLLDTLVMVRRMKKDVLEELPSKCRDYVKVGVDEGIMTELKETLREKEAAVRDAARADVATAEQLNMRIQALTSKCYALTGQAKVKGALAYLRQHIFKSAAGRDGDDEAEQEEEDTGFPCRSLGARGDVVMKGARSEGGQRERKKRRVDGTREEAVIVVLDDDDEEGEEQQHAGGAQGRVSCRLGEPLVEWPKVVLFAHHQEVMEGITSGLRSMGVKAVRIDGQTPPQKRHELQRQFQEDRGTHAAVLSITACATGLNLTAAAIAVFVELYWVPGQLFQAEDRIHRLGQTADVVRYIYLISDGTTDEQLWRSMTKKEAVLSTTTGLGESRKSDWHSLQAKPHIAPMAGVAPPGIAAYFRPHAAPARQSSQGLVPPHTAAAGGSSSPRPAVTPQQQQSHQQQQAPRPTVASFSSMKTAAELLDDQPLPNAPPSAASQPTPVPPVLAPPHFPPPPPPPPSGPPHSYGLAGMSQPAAFSSQGSSAASVTLDPSVRQRIEANRQAALAKRRLREQQQKAALQTHM